MKSVILVQVKNSFAQLPAFLAHHKRLVDQIILLDHNSSVDLKDLECAGVQIFRISAQNFAQELFASYFIYKLKLHEEFDFLFLLDADEFLPFSSKEEIKKFMNDNKKESVLSMQWRNGFSSTDEPLNGTETLYFTHWRTSTHKLIYNIKRVRYVIPIPGNHNAKYPFLDSLLIQLRPIRKDSGLGLLHIPFVGLQGLRQKLSTYPADSFRDKLFRDMSAMGIRHDPTSTEFNLSDEELMSFVANYRSNTSTIRSDITSSSFEKVDFLAGLEDQISIWSARLAKCRPASILGTVSEEAELIQKLRANRVFYNRRLARAFGLQEDGTYAFMI